MQLGGLGVDFGRFFSCFFRFPDKMKYSPIEFTSYYATLFLRDTSIDPSLFVMVVARFVSTNLQRSEAVALVTMEPEVRSLFNISMSISIHIIPTLWVSCCWCRIFAFKPVGFVSEMDFIWYAYYCSTFIYSILILISIECHVIT